MASYQLTENDLDTQKEWSSAPVRAARNPNPAVLQALMAYYQEGLSRWEQLSQRERKFLQYYGPNEGLCGAIRGTYESPLTAAIQAKLTCNVNFLLALGADCNGVSAHNLSDYFVRFLRGRDARIDVSSFVNCPPRVERLATAKAKGIESQLAPLTSAELDKRRVGFPRFWTEPNVPAQRLRMNTALAALEVAAQCGYEELFDIVHTAGAKDSSWQSNSEMQEDSPLEIPSEAPLSKLSVPSPVHQAIASGHQSMLNKLFRAYNHTVLTTIPWWHLQWLFHRFPLLLPSVICQVCMNASVTCLHTHVLPPICTPVFEIHPLHFAIARHNPEFLVWIAASIPGGHATAGRTALGHTLLHMAVTTQQRLDQLLTDSSKTQVFTDLVEQKHAVCQATTREQYFVDSIPFSHFSLCVWLLVRLLSCCGCSEVGANQLGLWLHDLSSFF